MKVFMTGGTGFIGRAVAARLIRDGHSVTVLTRLAKGIEEPYSGISFLQGDPAQKGPWQEAVPGHDAVINLAGASIFGKWTKAYKQKLVESRINTTRNLVEAFTARANEAVTLLSASAVGYYGFRGDDGLGEDASPGDDFLARLVVDWEGEAMKAGEKGARVVLPRFGLVLGEKGGALGQMAPLFKAFIGGPVGSGRQWFSWIHIRDLAEAMAFLLTHAEISGPVNLCSPNPVRNRDLSKALGRALHRPSLLRTPDFLIRLILGEFGSVILEGQRVLPRALLDLGFVFQFPEIGEALRDVVRG